MKDEIGILGGDVYKLISTHLDPLPENWSCEPTEKESEGEYYLRSKSESLKYIKNYPVQPGKKILFSITFTEKII
jgi:Immunity protein 40